MIHYLIWQGTDSRIMHVRVPNIVPIIRPEERVSHVTIPGRAGELTQTEGEDIYNSYIQSVALTVVGRDYVRPAEAWLRGDGYVTFDAQPTLKQKARIINAVEFERHSRNRELWHATAQFYCEPLKEAYTTESDITVTTGGTLVTNPGDIVSKPRIVINGSGDMTILMGGKTLILTGVTSGTVIDSDTEWILVNGTPVSGIASGEFPVLEPGEHAVQWTGNISSLVITPRWRYL